MSVVPRLSIGLPVYNGERYLNESLDSLLGQSYENFELIISDNASTDGTAGSATFVSHATLALPLTTTSSLDRPGASYSNGRPTTTFTPVICWNIASRRSTNTHMSCSLTRGPH
jgi:hypothetical protein